ncbi:MAG: CDP-alcohol phosphatidyltransferase family protein [Bacteroidia bacterium]
MLSVYQLKPRFQQLLSPLLNMMHHKGITPNTITLAAIGLSLIIGIALWFSPQVPALIWAVPAGLLLRMALNALDGMMARKYHLQSRWGEVLNELGDVVSDILVYLPLLVLVPGKEYIVWLFVLLSVVNEFSGVLAKALGGERRYDGPMGKSDRAFTVGLICLLTGIHAEFASWLPWVLVLAIALLCLSTYVRIHKSIQS